MPTIKDIPQELIVDLKDKVAIVYDNGLFLEFARVLAKSFKKVYYYMPWKNGFPKSNQYIVGEGITGIERIHNFFDYVDEGDIFVFPDVYDGDLQLYLESQGKLVWGSRKGEELELERAAMNEHMKSLGLYVAPYVVLIGIAALREYLKEHDNVYVKCSILRGDFESFHSLNYKFVEPKLDELEYRLGAMKSIKEFVVEDAYDNAVETGCDLYTVDGEYPTATLAGIEVKDLGYIGKINKYSDLSPKVTDFNEKISNTLKNYGYRGFFSTEVRISKSKPPYMLDFCFSDDTEVLSNNGWKLFKDLLKTDTVATLNVASNEIEYQLPTDYINYEYEGKMIELSNKDKTIECLVTPNHLVLRKDRNKKKLFKQRADSLTDKGYIPRTGTWVGNKEEFFELPEYHNEWDWMGKDSHGEDYVICTKIKHEPAIKIPMKNWAAFLGWYLSEGSTSAQYVTQISQTKFVDEVATVLDGLPFTYNYDDKMFRISSVQLTTYLKQFGLCDKKFVPKYIKESNPEVIREFLDQFNLGDGSRHKGNKIYFTTSKDLADDIQECIFKVGSLTNIVKQDKKGTIAKFGDKEYIRNHDIYVLTERNTFHDYYFETQSRKERYINEIDYNSEVFCVTVPNGTLYVRRNGKPFWSSNCARLGSPPNELYQMMYKNLAEIMWYGSQGYLIDPTYEHKYGVEVFIHSTWADQNWQEIEFPKKYRDNIKLRNACCIDGKFYAVPQSVGLPEVGAIVAEGDSIKETIDKVKEIADTIQGFYLEIKMEAVDTALKQFKELEEFGVKIL